MRIVLFALRYKYTIGVLAILILLFGIMSGKRMSTDILPRVESPELSRSSQLFDTASGTMRAEFLIENKDLALPAGLTGLATFKLPPAAGTFILTRKRKPGQRSAASPLLFGIPFAAGLETRAPG